MAKRQRWAAQRDDLAIEFRRLVRGHSPSDLRWLLNTKAMTDTLYIYGCDKREARKPLPSEIPWPMLYILTRHHKSFRTTGKIKPAREVVNQAFQTFSDRVRWKAYFDGFRQHTERPCCFHELYNEGHLQIHTSS